MKSVKIHGGDYEVTLKNGSVYVVSFDPEFPGAEKWLWSNKKDRNDVGDPQRTKRECLAELAGHPNNK